MKSLALAWFATLILWPASLRADTWRDPSFREMIAQADVIGLFKVVEGGSFKARLTPVAIYKGKVDGEIWLGGFSNKYGPIDTFSAGQLYLLFVNRYNDYKSAFMSSSNFGKQSVARKAFEAFEFVASQPNGYMVPTPTAGEYRVRKGNVFLDLAEVNTVIAGIPLEDVKRLIAHSTGKNQNGFIQHCKEQVRKNLAGNNVYLLSNYLAMLELADESAYDDIFSEVTKSSSWQAKFTLAKLLGNVKGDQSRDLLVALVGDTSGVVQGEAIRQLARTQPAEFLGPLLIQQLDSAHSDGLYSSLMSPVRNSWESGKIQIIETLAELKHEPAIPYLLPLLQTDDRMLFNEALTALVELDLKKAYASALNQRLADPNLSWEALSDITRVIEMEDLLQCKDALLIQLTTHNRNGNTYKTLLLSALATLAAKDSTIETAILADFENFFSYVDTLESSRQEEWYTHYIKTFAALESEEARPLIYRAIFEWTGLRPDLHTSAQAFEKKRAKEDSLRNLFSHTAVLKKYKLEDVLFFGLTKSRFIISVRLPDNKAPSERQKLVADALRLPEHDIYFVGKDDMYFYDRQNRFDKHFNRVIKSYIEYAVALPHKTDLMFMKALMTSDRWEAESYNRELSAAVKQIETALTK
jgi:hypothetical protein